MALVRVLSALGLMALFIAAPVAADPFGLLPDESGRVTVRADQWQIESLEARRAWRQATGDGVTVAVIDSGVDATHPDLAGRVLPGLDLVSGSGDGTADGVGHGTAVAGLIAGSNGDRKGVLGLAPGAKILPVRVLNDDNRYDSPRMVAEGILWAVDQGAKVINLSLGSSVASPELADAIDYAYGKDVVVVACVGNVLPGGSPNVWHPASEPGVIAVTALGSDGLAWRGALSGPQTVLAAPGADLIGARPGGYQRVEGTSFAAPLVAATAALIRSKHRDLSAASVVQRLISTARDAGTPGRDDRYGFGVVNPVAALTAEVPPALTNPLDDTPPPGNAGFGAALPESSVVAYVPGLAPSIIPDSLHDAVAALPSASAADATWQAVVAAAPPELTATSPPVADRSLILLTALAGFASLVGGGLTLLRRL